MKERVEGEGGGREELRQADHTCIFIYTEELLATRNTVASRSPTDLCNTGKCPQDSSHSIYAPTSINPTPPDTTPMSMPFPSSLPTKIHHWTIARETARVPLNCLK